MNGKFKYLMKNVGILTISNFASKIMVFLLVPLYTSVLSTTEYGTYDLVVSTVQLLFPLLSLNIVDAVMRYSMDKTCSANDIAVIGIKYISRSFIPVALFLVICTKIRLIPQISGYEGLIFLYFIFYVTYQFFIQFAKGLEKVGDMGIAGVLGTLVLIISNLLLLLVFKCGLYGFFIANILSQAIPSIYFALRLQIWKFCKSLEINKSLQKEMLLYCLPLIFTSLSWWVNNMSSRYTVALICGTAANGILSVAYKIPSILNTIQQILIQAWQISAIKEFGNSKTKEFYGETFRYLNFIMCISCGILIIFSKFIAGFLYASEFYIAWKYVPFLLVSVVLNTASGFLGPILLAQKDSGNMAKSAIYGAVVNLLLNIILVYIIDIQGATIASVFSSFIIYVIRKKAVGDKILINSYWNILLNWIILCVLAILCIYSAKYIFQFLLLSTLFLVNHTDAIKILRKFRGLF